MTRRQKLDAARCWIKSEWHEGCVKTDQDGSVYVEGLVYDNDLLRFVVFLAREERKA